MKIVDIIDVPASVDAVIQLEEEDCIRLINAGMEVPKDKKEMVRLRDRIVGTNCEMVYLDNIFRLLYVRRELPMVKIDRPKVVEHIKHKKRR